MLWLYAAAALMWAQPHPSIHQIEFGNHMDEPVPVRYYGARQFVPKRTKSQMSYIVYGYLPYWISNLSNIQWDKLTHIAYFSVETNSDGSLGDDHGWPDTTLVSTAHSNGVKVELAFTLFSSTSIKTLVNSSSNRARFINNAINKMEQGNADGISIDFEGVPSDARSGFTSLIRELRNELDNRGHVDAGITIAAPAVDWSDAFDVGELVKYARIFIMAYDYFWSGSDYAGPTGIFRTSSAWRVASQYNTLRSVAKYAHLAGDDYRHQIILGVPYYGREYKTSSGSWPSSATSNVGTQTYSDIMADGGATDRDDDICEAARIWNSGVWHQIWFMDQAGLDCRLTLVFDQGIGGIGMWALGYDGSRTELWDTLASYDTNPPQNREGFLDNPIRITSFPYTDTRDTSDGYWHFNYYSCQEGTEEAGREFVYRVDVCTAGTLEAHVPAYDYSVLDPDVHILGDLREDACIARGDLDASTHVNPGTYYVVVDTYVKSGVELEGTYTLTVDFTPDTAGSGCPSGTYCDGGECVCENGGTYCDGSCVDTSTDRNNCGGCGNECGDEQQCVGGQCVDAGQCPDGWLECGGQCVNPDTDEENCGSCGNICGEDEECRDGICVITGGGEDPGDSTTYSNDNDDDQCYTRTECACRAPGSKGTLPPVGLILLLVAAAALLRKDAD